MSYAPGNVLSSNMKCKYSINLPIKGHCRPTALCSQTCYAKTGRLVMPNCTTKQVWVSQYLAGNDISRLVLECQATARRPALEAVRLNGSGDLLPTQVLNIIKLAEACPDTEFWGMTRKINIAHAINDRLPNLRLLLTADATSPAEVWGYDGAMCFGPRMPDDEVPRDRRILTVFPYHFRGVTKDVPFHNKDCKAVRHELKGCHECGRCWKW